MIKIYNRFDGELIREFDLDTLSGADLRGAYLSGAYLRGAYLSGADLRGADLRGAYLSGAYLSGADLRGADLRGAYLGGADLRDADLSGADLRGADLSGADLNGSLIVIYGLEWQVFITKNHIRIGCQAHDMGKWENFTNEEIINMSGNALNFWKENKEMLINLCKRLSK